MLTGVLFLMPFQTQKLEKGRIKEKRKQGKNEILGLQKAALAQKTGTVAQDLLKCEKKGVI